MTIYRGKAKFEKKLPRFKIFYQDGSTLTDKQVPLDKIIKTGVICVLAEEGNSGQRLYDGYDYYCYTKSGFIGASHTGLNNYLSLEGFKLVLLGAGKTDEAIIEKANSDTYLLEE